MNYNSQLPEHLRPDLDVFAAMLETVRRLAGRHLAAAAYLLRQAVPATDVVVDVTPWLDREVGVQLLEISAEDGPHWWRHGDKLPTRDPQRSHRPRLTRREWCDRLAAVKFHIDAALDFASPTALGWQGLEIRAGAATPYLVRLPQQLVDNQSAVRPRIGDGWRPVVARIEQLRPGDRFQLTPLGQAYTVTNEIDSVPGKECKVWVVEQPWPLVLPAGHVVEFASVTRTVMVTCLLCQEPIEVALDDALDQTASGCLCGRCQPAIPLENEGV